MKSTAIRYYKKQSPEARKQIRDQVNKSITVAVNDLQLYHGMFWMKFGEDLRAVEQELLHTEGS